MSRIWNIRRFSPRLCHLESRDAPATFKVVDNGDAGVGTGNDGDLRYVITQAELTAAADTIVFDLPANKLLIGLQTKLPDITKPLIIDGTSQPGYKGIPLVTVSGQATPSGNGFTIKGTDTTIKGLWIAFFKWNGIQIDNTDIQPTGKGVIPINGNNVIVHNIINLNQKNGVVVKDSLSNFIGGTTPAGVDNDLTGNMISDNFEDGIRFQGAFSFDNQVMGNRIGTALNGQGANGNGQNGIRIEFHAFRNVIGGVMPGGQPDPAPRNIIANSKWNGVSIFTGEGKNRIIGNYIGTDITGTQALGNQQNGISIVGSNDNVIGVPTSGNLISGNIENGIMIRKEQDLTADRTQIVRNRIGTDATGLAPLGNGQKGIHLNGANNTLMIGNWIQFNNADGITIQDSNYNLVGGSLPDSNTITANTGNGVSVVNSGGSSYGNAILSNSIYENGGLGIDLADDGVTLNDNEELDADDGPNHFQNFPTITWNGLWYTVELWSTPNTDFYFQFFVSDNPDPSGYGEGQSFAGDFNWFTDASGHAVFLLQTMETGVWLTATATGPDGSTSEFSEAIYMISGGGMMMTLGGEAFGSGGDGSNSSGSSSEDDDRLISPFDPNLFTLQQPSDFSPGEQSPLYVPDRPGTNRLKSVFEDFISPIGEPVLSM